LPALDRRGIGFCVEQVEKLDSWNVVTMNRLTKLEHRNRVFVGIIGAVVFAVAGAVMNFDAHGPFKASEWTLLFVPVLPLLAYGCSHLSRYRGYSSGVSYGLIVLVMAGAALATPILSASTVGIVFIAATAIPPLILLTLNIRPGTFRSSREPKR
jgi:tetrahydromethanopterin S-methyltransferase subunit E